SLYYKMAERLNCIQNQITTHDRVLIKNKVVAFIITGGQDNVQACAGQLLGFWGELGFAVPPFPYIAHTRGWDAADMERNVRQARGTAARRGPPGRRATRALDCGWALAATGGALDKPMERSGRKAQPLAPAPAEEV